MNSKKIVRLIIDIIIITALIALDQFTKYMAVLNLKDKPAYNIITNVFELRYLENRGAAFGMLQNQKTFFVAIACIMLVVVFYILVKVPDTSKYLLIKACMIMIGAGAVGNLIDRVNYDYVVDFFYFVLINFPIFNVADIYVSVSCFVLIVAILFVYKDADLTFIRLKKNGTV